MKKVILITILIVITFRVAAQTTITAADMPVAGDTLRYSVASVVGANINLYDTGSLVLWDFTNLVATAQQVDTYKTALQVSPVYALTAPAGCYGYKVADSVPGLGSFLPVQINELYTFFNKLTSPSSYAAVAFGAQVSGLPVAAKYTTADNWYFFPLTYHRQDSSAFSLPITIPSLGSLKENGSRITRVDAVGSIRTPFYNVPVNCLRVRSEVNQVDSINYSIFNLGIPVNTVEYKWLVNGEHYPALWITTTKTGTTETISSITYRDSARGLSVPMIKPTAQELTVYPNPAAAGHTKIDVPASWGGFVVAVYDIQGREVHKVVNNTNIDLSALPAGQYLARVSGQGHLGYCVITR